MFGIMLYIFFFNEKKVVLTLWKFNGVSPPRHYTQKLRMAPNRSCSSKEENVQNQEW